MDAPDDAANNPMPAACPVCGRPLPRDVVPLGWVQCPACGAQVELVAVPSVEPGDEEGTPEPPPDPDAALNALRVRQIAALRRGGYRTRSYCFVAAAALAVVAAQLAFMGLASYRDSGGRLTWPAIYAVLVLLALWGCAHFAGRVLRLTNELRQSPTAALPPPEHEPDFSTLGDGSQQWKNLEDVR
jgi:hypothetical protein